MNLIQLEPRGRYVFVGETHGDLDASQKIIRDYLDDETRICFLGDYVDRGKYSRENIDFLLETKREHLDQIYLTKGDHETHLIKPVSPHEFWHSLDILGKARYHNIFSKFPLVISVGGIIGLHGGLPLIGRLEDINNITLEDTNWDRIVWGCFSPSKNEEGEYQEGLLFGRKYFLDIMGKINKSVLVRTHQPEAPETMFDNRCLTLSTSCVIGQKRKIAIADFNQKRGIKSIDDLMIQEI